MNSRIMNTYTLAHTFLVLKAHQPFDTTKTSTLIHIQLLHVDTNKLKSHYTSFRFVLFF